MNGLLTKAIKERMIDKFERSFSSVEKDLVVVEEPLEIQIRYFLSQKWNKKSLAVTMRTPSNDIDLATGFLFSEGIIGQYEAIEAVEKIEDNILIINLLKNIEVNLESLERNFYATSSCGLCGKASIEKLEKITCFFPQKRLPKINPATILKLPALLRNIQPLFDQTGGIHAAGLFSPKGELLSLAEDVGRHNAVDKLIGNCLKKRLIPLRNQILMLSGRVGFELVQKAKMAGIPIIAAVGAPSSLAIELAEESDITLIGFLRGERFNVYCGRERLIF